MDHVDPKIAIFFFIYLNIQLNRLNNKWEMQKLPSRLVVMIKHFVELHLEKISEENQRSNFF